MVVAVEIQEAQTAKEAFGSDALADSLGDANATHFAGTAVVKAPKSLKHIILLKGPNFTGTELSGQDQGRVHLPLNFYSEALITSPKRLFEAAKTAVADLIRFQTPASEVGE